MTYRHMLFVFLAALYLMTVTSCKKETTQPAKEQVTGDMYPLINGNKIRFNGYIRHAQNDTNITATGAYYQARMTVFTAGFPPLPSFVAPLAGTTYFIQDSSLVVAPSTWNVSGFYVKRSAATSGDIWFLTNAGRFYRTLGVYPGRIDSLKWVLLVKEGAFIGESWVAFDSSYTSSTVGSARLRVDCVFEGKVSITVNSQTFEAYKLVATRKVYAGGSSTPLQEGSTATIWLVPNVGIVKFIYNSDGETPGFERNYLSRNF